jgi:beta-glucosidase
MVRQKERNASREGLLRNSFDNTPRTSSDSDLNMTNFVDANATTRSTSSRPIARAYEESSRFALLRQKLAKHSKLAIISAIVMIIFWSVLAGGGLWLYKLRPLDGHSPPWYPTPQGGTAESWKESYAKAAQLVERMSLPSKVNITTGQGWQMGLAVGNTAPALDVDFPGLALQDGPLGLRFADNATAWPAGVTVGATWNKDLMYKRGRGHGLEARMKGINVLLGPCVGPLGRMPAGGRNWEGFGADPYLQGVAAAETIRGIQDERVMATIKHYIGNEQEHYRQSWEWGLPNAISSNIGDRTLHELYLWPFADAVRAGVASVMCSYQMTNNSYSCGNSKLLNGLLKDELGFQGFVQSDWLAQRSGVGSALAGLDMSMPGDGLRWANGDSLWGSHLTESILNGSLPLTRLNDMVTRIVASWYQLGQDDKKMFDRKGPNFSSWTKEKMGVLNPGSGEDTDIRVVNQYINVQGEGDTAHFHLARQIAAEGSVLVKNNGSFLPISRKGWPSSSTKSTSYRVGIFGEDAVVGDDPNACEDRACNQGTLASGWGSGAVEFPYLISPASALTNGFDVSTVNVTTFGTNTPPFSKDESILNDRDLCLVFVNADSGEGYKSWDGIKGDRNDLDIQKDGDELVIAVADGCGGGKGNTVVVVHAVGPVIVEKWIDHPNVKAVILAHLPGQESGAAIADIIFGDINPSGKLPYTLGKSLDDYGEGAKVLYYANSALPQQNFSEGAYIDYRHFDKFGVTPRFEFGFGLSYTTFKYTKMTIKENKPKSLLPDRRPADAAKPPQYSEVIPDPNTALFPEGFKKLKKFIYPYINQVSDIKQGSYPYPEGYNIEQPLSQAGGAPGGNPSLYETHYTITVDVTNAGDVTGSEVVQLYLSYPKSAKLTDPPAPLRSVAEGYVFDNDMNDFPVQVLRGFEKIELKKGEKKTVTFQLTRRDLSYWDTGVQNWVIPMEGKFRIRVGGSSRIVGGEKEF